MSAYIFWLRQDLSSTAGFLYVRLAAMPEKGSWLHYLAVCGNLHPVESALVYAIGLGPVLAPPTLQSLFWTNAAVQLAIFLPFVQLPVMLTGHMMYVDIGWPSGLVAISIASFLMGTGFWLRKCLISVCFLLHGGRMALGAIVMFGQSSSFTYRFSEDLPRYQYAKYKWSKIDGMPEASWMLKMQQETLSQGFSNSVLLCLPAFLAASDPQPQIHFVEWLGLAVWAAAWAFESSADYQKLLFLDECKRLQKKDATLGLPPYDKYFLWALCRHPNYFGEWCAWVGLTLAAVPSLLSTDVVPQQGSLVFLVYAVALVMIPRMLYDCLVHWTGAGPAEHFSAKKRAGYREYQEKVRCFFPLPLRGVDHHMKPGWPHFEAIK